MTNLKTNKTNEQKALDYIMYMMASNIFNKSLCQNKTREEKLFLYYKDLNAKNALALEEACAFLADEILAVKLPSKVLESDVKAYFIKGKADNYIVGFKGQGWSLSIESYLNSMNKIVAYVTFTTKSYVEKREYIIRSRVRKNEDGSERSITVKMNKGLRKSKVINADESGRQAAAKKAA